MSTVSTDIFDACRKNDRSAAEALYAHNPNVINAHDAKGFTPLILAVYNNSAEVVDFLLEKGADINAQDAAGNTALMGVCFKGYKVLAKKLIEAGASINQVNVNNANALTFAATFGQIEIASMLLENGADYDQPDARGKTPYNHAIIQENIAMVELIEQYRNKSKQ